MSLIISQSLSQWIVLSQGRKKRKPIASIIVNILNTNCINQKSGNNVIVQSQSAKKAILAALADEEMTKILDSVMYHSKSIVDITRENNIPHTTCYRKTKWLLNEGLVIVDKIIITPEGKKFSLYHSVLKSINVKYESNNVIVEAEQNFDIIKKTMARFYSLE
jgi:predicted transcriptional regulator